MNIQTLALPTLILVTISSVSLIVFSDWRVRLGLLAVLYLGVFLILSLNWPVSLAVTKLVAGWMAAAVLGMALIDSPVPSASSDSHTQFQRKSFPGFVQNLRIKPATFFYLFAAILIGMFTFSISSYLLTWIPGLQNEVVWAGLLLLGMGILQLGFRSDIFSTILGMLTMVSGFEIIYTSIERSTLVAGLLAGITLGLALVGAYLILSPQFEEPE